MGELHSRYTIQYNLRGLVVVTILQTLFTISKTMFSRFAKSTIFISSGLEAISRSSCLNFCFPCLRSHPAPMAMILTPISLRRLACARVLSGLRDCPSVSTTTMSGTSGRSPPVFVKTWCLTRKKV